VNRYLIYSPLEVLIRRTIIHTNFSELIRSTFGHPQISCAPRSLLSKNLRTCWSSFLEHVPLFLCTMIELAMLLFVMMPSVALPTSAMTDRTMGSVLITLGLVTYGPWMKHGSLRRVRCTKPRNLPEDDYTTFGVDVRSPHKWARNGENNVIVTLVFSSLEEPVPSQVRRESLFLLLINNFLGALARPASFENSCVQASVFFLVLEWAGECHQIRAHDVIGAWGQTRPSRLILHILDVMSRYINAQRLLGLSPKCVLHCSYLQLSL
jgi:hypothetical protein